VRVALAAVFSTALLACSGEAGGENFPYFEEQGGRVRDMAALLDDATEENLSRKLEQAELAYGPQMGIVTVNSLKGYDIADFSIEYARAWGLGDAKRNDGVMLLVAPNERRVRIEIGKGIEASFTDIYCKEVLDEDIIPFFQTGDMQAGIVAGTDRLIENMRKHPTLPVNDNSPLDLEEAA